MRIPRTPRSLLRLLLNGGLVAFFLAGGIVNIVPPDAVRSDYERWGYPDWFHYVTGSIEILSAGLLALPRSRELGRATGATVMLAALGTLLLHVDYAHAAGPAIILTALAASRHLDGKALEARWEGRVF